MFLIFQKTLKNIIFCLLDKTLFLPQNKRDDAKIHIIILLVMAMQKLFTHLKQL